jgi:hypothetical protein
MLDAVEVEYAARDYERRHTWIEILKLPEQRLVTSVEVLSPTNKGGKGLDEYLEKRDDLLARDGPDRYRPSPAGRG